MDVDPETHSVEVDDDVDELPRPLAHPSTKDTGTRRWLNGPLCVHHPVPSMLGLRGGFDNDDVAVHVLVDAEDGDRIKTVIALSSRS